MLRTRIRSLFVNDTMRFHMISPQKNALVGSYLFYALTHDRVIRSGKAYARDENFGTRIKAHKTGSLKGDSFFYRMYPDETLLADAVGQPWGCFSRPRRVIGLAFDKNDGAGVAILLKDIKDGGIMRWSKEALQAAGTLPLDDSLVEKKLQMVSYILEITDDLDDRATPQCVPGRIHAGVHDGEGPDTRQPMSSPIYLSHDCTKKCSVISKTIISDTKHAHVVRVSTTSSVNPTSSAAESDRNFLDLAKH